MKLVLAPLLLAGLARGHVRLFFDASQGSIENPLSVRNANSPTSDGRMSVAGPCGGAESFGANGVHMTTQGTAMTLKINYNGGHRSPANEFHVIYQCSSEGPSESDLKAIADDTSAGGMNEMMTLTLKAGTTPAPGGSRADSLNYVLADTGNQVTGGYNMMFDLPMSMEGKCTVSVLDQRDWGGCVDLEVMAATTMATLAPGQTAASTTTMPAVSGQDLAAWYKSPPGSCVGNFPTCCCMDGMFNIVNNNTMSTTMMMSNLTILNDRSRDEICSRIAGITTVSATLTSSDVLSFVATGMVERIVDPNPYEFKASIDRIAFTNIHTDTPRFCDGFAIRWTETAQALEMQHAMYTAAHAQANTIISRLATCNCSGPTAEEADVLMEAAKNMSMHYAEIERLNTTANPGELLFVTSNMTNFTLTHASVQASIKAVAGTAGKGTESNSADAAIAVGVLIILGLVAVVVVYRAKIAELLGADETMVVNQGAIYSEAPTPTARTPEPVPATRTPPARPAPRLEVNGNYAPL